MNQKIETLAKRMLLFYVVMVLCQRLITYYPAVVMFIPNMLGY